MEAVADLVSQVTDCHCSVFVAVAVTVLYPVDWWLFDVAMVRAMILVKVMLKLLDLKRLQFVPKMT